MSSDKLKKMVFEDCNIKLQTGNSGQNTFLQFVVTINLAYIGALYMLKKFEIFYILLLSLIIFLINFSITIMYIREHFALEDSIKQIKKIYDSYDENFTKDSKINKWYMFTVNFQDKFKSITWYVISLLLSTLTIFPIVIICFKYYQLYLDYTFFFKLNKLFLPMLISTIVILFSKLLRNYGIIKNDNGDVDNKIQSIKNGNRILKFIIDSIYPTFRK